MELDGPNIGGGGGSSLTIGGTLTNSSTNGNGVYIGNTSITSADTLTVNGTGGLSNTGSRSTSKAAPRVQSTLNIANDAAGFGTAGVETGTVYPRKRRAAGVQERPDHDDRWRAVAQRRELRASPTPATPGHQQRADRPRPPSPAISFCRTAQRSATTGDLSVTGNGAVELDGPNIGGGGGSSLTIGGTLTNSSTNGNGVYVGNTSITSADTLTVNGTGGLSNDAGEINIEGSATVQSTLDVANGAAGFGTVGVETGTVYPRKRRAAGVRERPDHDDRRRAVAQRRELRASPTPARWHQQRADRPRPPSPGISFCRTAQRSAPTGDLSVTGNGAVELDGPNNGGGGGSSLTIGGTLTNSSTNGNGVSVGNTSITSADTVTVNGLAGSPTPAAARSTSRAAAPSSRP